MKLEFPYLRFTPNPSQSAFTVKMALTNNDILCKYFETSVDNTSTEMIQFLNRLIDKKRPLFENIAQIHNIQFNQLLEKLYQKSAKFPFYLTDLQVQEYLA